MYLYAVMHQISLGGACALVFVREGVESTTLDLFTKNCSRHATHSYMDKAMGANLSFLCFLSINISVLLRYCVGAPP